MKNFKKVVIYSHHSGGTGHYCDQLFSYLLDTKKTKELIKVNFPFDNKYLNSIRFRKYSNGVEVLKFESIIKFNSPMILSYLKDFIVGFYYGVIYCRNADLFIGMNNLLSSLGILQKKLGIISDVYHVVIDYSPVRFQNPLLNKIYYLIDKFALYNSDTVFALNEEMLFSRVNDQGLDIKKINYFITPIGNNSGQRKNSDFLKNNKNTLVYFGNLLKGKGIQLFVPIAKKLIEKDFVDFKFLVIGGGNEDWLLEEVKKNHLENFFDIKGRIESHLEIEELLLSSSIAIAPYFVEDKNSISYYADPGKIKNYLGCGLPVVITPVPPIYKIIEKEHAGIVADYDEDSIANSVIEISKNLDEYRKSAIKLGKYYDWNDIFSRYFEQ